MAENWRPDSQDENDPVNGSSARPFLFFCSTLHGRAMETITLLIWHLGRLAQPVAWKQLWLWPTISEEVKQKGFPGGSVGEESTCNAGDARDTGSRDTTSKRSTQAFSENLWANEWGPTMCNPGNSASWVRKIAWRKAWQPSPVFLPGEPHRQGILAGCHPCGHRVSDTTEKALTQSE